MTEFFMIYSSKVTYVVFSYIFSKSWNYYNLFSNPIWNQSGREHSSEKGKIWVPTLDLTIRIMIIGHCSASYHRGGETTFQVISNNFWWENMKEDIMGFVKNCLHCLVNAVVVPRPFVELMHAKERNHLIHYDYLYINNKNPDFGRYSFVLKDDLTNFVRLIPSKVCDHVTVAEAILAWWYADFRFPCIHVSDQGSHFKNSVIRELHRLADSKHHFTVAYSPWSNGTVGLVNESILCFLRSLCLNSKCVLPNGLSSFLWFRESLTTPK
jgi:hypothetical protein